MSTEDTRIRPFRFIRALAALLIAAFLLGLQPVPQARAATITVDTLTDNESGGCGINNCTLREAIADAADGDTIDLSSVTGTIDLNNSEPKGQLTIDKDLTITRSGSGTLTINGGGNSRVFYIDNGATVTISGLTIANGSAPVATPEGGGIYNLGTLTIENSTISSNDADFQGGGIYNQGTLTIEDSTLSSNTVDLRGGGIYNESVLTIENSTLSGNTSDGESGGIHNAGTLTIEKSTLSNNAANLGAGGIYNAEDGDLNIADSNLSSNTANNSTGGIYNKGTLTITNSTISDNAANSHGGGIVNLNSDLTIENSTLSGNQSGDHGGGLAVNGGQVFLYNVTISENVADSDNDGTGSGGGVYVYSGQLNLENTIIANNQDGSSAPDPVHPDCSRTVTSRGYNLIEDTSGCTISGDTTGNLTGQAALLDPLADNGGETKTHALGDGSPAIDAGNPSGCQDDDGNDLSADQRGELRPTGGTCDIGAYEKQGLDLEAVKTNDVGDAITLGATFQWTVTISNTGSQDIDFGTDQTIFQDDLPSGATYGAPIVQNVTNVTGSIDCQLIGTKLMCDPVGHNVTLGAETGSFDVVFDVTPSATGTLTNPDSAGVCQVEPDERVTEINEMDNDCSDRVAVESPNLKATKTNDSEDEGTVGTPFNWLMTIANLGTGDATFTNGQTIFQDDLPSTGASYGTPSAQNFTDITNSGDIDCNTVGTTLTCTANGVAVTFGAVTGSFDVMIEVTPNVEGNLINPDPNGICQIDPDDHIDEDNESDNDCADTVTVTAAGGDDDDDGSSRPSRNCPVGVPGGICRLKNMVKTTVFENTVSDGSYIRIQEKSGGNFKLGDRVFDITIIGPDGKEITNFDPPIEVCLRPTNAQLKAAGWHYGNLSLFHSHAGGPWETIYNTYEQDGKVCAKVWQLSRFALGVSPLPDTGFAPGVEHALPAQPAEKAYAAYGRFRLEIPSLGMDIPIVGVPLTADGWDVRWLGEQAGWLQGSAFPTWAGNTAITAHVWDADNNPGPFVELDALQHGDEIVIQAWGLTHTYEVRGVEQVRPDDLRALPHEDYDVLTLLTCQGFDEDSNQYDWRLAVRAVLIDVEAE